jgi:hypothetical protein
MESGSSTLLQLPGTKIQVYKSLRLTVFLSKDQQDFSSKELKVYIVHLKPNRKFYFKKAVGLLVLLG